MLSEPQMPTIHPGWFKLQKTGCHHGLELTYSMAIASQKDFNLTSDFNNHYRATIHAMNQGFESPLRNNAQCHTLWYFNIAIEHGPFIVDLPMKNGGSFHSKLLVYQAGYVNDVHAMRFPHVGIQLPQKTRPDRTRSLLGGGDQ